MLVKAEKIQRVLVVAPLSILGVWKEEFQKFAAYPYQLTVLAGSSAKKAQQIKNAAELELQVLCVNYESAWRLERNSLHGTPT